MTPDNTFIEQTATGPVKVEFYGDRALAQSLLRLGRGQLGQMRVKYGVDHRLAVGEPGGFYNQWENPADGVTIQTITNDSLDIIRIFANRPNPKRKIKPRKTKLKEGIICGATKDEDGHLYPAKWSFDPVPIEDGMTGIENVSVTELPFLDGGTRGEALAVADQDDTVVGWQRVTEGDFAYVHAVRWISDTEVESLGFLNTVSKDMVATDINEDGTRIVGYGNAVGVPVAAWYWEDGQLHQLPDEGLGVPSGTKFKISPNGRYVVGTISVVEERLNNVRGAVWEIGDDGITVTRLPDPPTTSFREARDNPFGEMELEEYIDHNIPVNVDDNGEIAGFTSHNVGNWYIDHDAVPPFGPGHEGGSNSFQTDPFLPNTLFRYNAVTGDYRLLGGNGIAGGCANDDGTLCGNWVTGNVITEFFRETSGPTAGSWFTFTHWANHTVTAYYTKDDQQVELEINAAALDISEDGDVIVGATTILTDYDQPVAWEIGSNKHIGLPLPEGRITGYATGVAMPEQEIELAPEEDYA